MSVNKEFVKFDKVDKSYDGKVLVVKDLQLDIAEGEFITMLGPSGSGKTTCLMMLAGFETPSSGEILIDNKSMRNVEPNLRPTNMVFQNYAIFPHLNVEENVAYGLRKKNIFVYFLLLYHFFIPEFYNSLLGCLCLKLIVQQITVIKTFIHFKIFPFHECVEFVFYLNYVPTSNFRQTL